MTDTSEPVTQNEAERRAALAALAVGADVVALPEGDKPVERTGREVYCGGDEPRLLVRKASSLGWGDGKGGYQRCEAVPGDVVTLTKAQAARLDSLGVTVDPDADLEEVQADQADGLWTDDQVKAAKAGELVAYVTQNPDERARVRAVEEKRDGPRKGDGPRPTVIKATEETPAEDAEAAAEAAARAAAAADGGQGEGDDPPPAE